MPVPFLSFFSAFFHLFSFVSSSFIGRKISLRAGAWATIFLSVWQPAPRTRLCFVSLLAYVFAPTSSELLGRWVLTNCDIQVEFGCSAVLAYWSFVGILVYGRSCGSGIHRYTQSSSTWT